MATPDAHTSTSTSPLIKPAVLRPGDRVAVVSLSWGGPGAFPARYAVGRRRLEEVFGLEVVETRHALRDPEWIARNPRARADDLMEAFSDRAVRGVISSIGGEDSIRLLPHVDLAVLRANPKLFMGYSDTTVTHFACRAAGLVSFYGPSVMVDFAENVAMHEYTVAALRRALFSSTPIGVLEPNTAGWTVERLDWADPANASRARKLQPSTPWRWLQGEGLARGPLLGGCAEVLEFLKGTAWWPPLEAWRGAILFLETSEEAPPPRELGRWMRNLGAQGVLAHLNGILVGRPGGDQLPVAEHAAYEEAIREVVAEEFGRPELPIVANLDFGHTEPKFVLPIGVTATIDCARQRVSIDESATVARTD